MADFQEKLKNLTPEKDFFIGIDSDGCVFDTMELKHKECFCPAYINVFNLQGVSRYAREVWDFVNLYSKTRGVNRFLALVEAVDLLRKRPEVTARGVEVPTLEGVRSWTAGENKLGYTALAEAVKESSDPDLFWAMKWSEDVTARIKKMVRGVKPFALVRQALQRMAVQADMIVVSQTPVNALEREWREHNIDSFVRAIAGQEMGTKSQHIKFTAKGKYDPDKILMIGDAPGDYRAAEKNNALFFPVIPGREENSWKELFTSGLDHFFNGTYRGMYQKKLLDSFDSSLPAVPPWEE